MFGRSSEVFLGGYAGRSKLEQIHNEAKKIIDEKNKEIQRYSQEIQKAEASLSQLKAELQSKTEKINKIILNQSTDDNNFQIDNEISNLNARHDEEVRQLIAKNEDELQMYRIKYGKMLKESEQWIEQHIDTVIVEKTAKVEAAKQDLERLKEQAGNTMLSATKQRTQFLQSSKTSSLMNSRRIQYLESQISEITSVSREELRDIKGKVEECLAAITIREQNYKAEIARFKQEYAEREKKYNEHIAVLKHQCETEKERYFNQINACNENIANISNVLKHLEKHHETQMKSTLNDLERMRTSIYTARARTIADPNETLATTRETNSLANKCIQMQQEIAVIESELSELNDENRDLQAQLARFDRAVYA